MEIAELLSLMSLVMAPLQNAERWKDLVSHYTTHDCVHDDAESVAPPPIRSPGAQGFAEQTGDAPFPTRDMLHATADLTYDKGLGTTTIPRPSTLLGNHFLDVGANLNSTIYRFFRSVLPRIFNRIAGAAPSTV